MISRQGGGGSHNLLNAIAAVFELIFRHCGVPEALHYWVTFKFLRHCGLDPQSHKSSLLNNPKAGLLRRYSPRNDSLNIRSMQGLPKSQNDKNLVPYYPSVLTTNSTPTPTLPLGEGEGAKRKAAFTLAEDASHGAVSDSHRKTAFTLAEVLITLGIIGVVAAMTMPALVQNYNKKITEVRLKKFYSVMNQAVDRLKVEYGDTKNWDYTVDNVYDGEGTAMDNLTDQSGQIMSNFKRYFGKVIKFTDEENVNVEGHNMTLFYFADGSAIMPLWYNNFDYEFFPKNAKKCLTYPHNERYGTCSFPFQFYTNSRNTFIPYYNGSDNMTMESLYENASKGCRNGNHISGNYCGLIIMKNNWTVPDDYPRKLAY